MNVHIHHFEELLDDDLPVIDAALQRIKRFYSGAVPTQPVDIWCNSRDRHGLLELIMRLPYAEGQGHITIGVVQRQPGAEVEFHS